MFAEGVVQTSRVRGSRAQRVPAATSRVASIVVGPPLLRIAEMSSGGSPPWRGRSVDEEVMRPDPSPPPVTRAIEGGSDPLTPPPPSLPLDEKMVACMMRLSIGTAAFGGKAQSSAWRYSRQNASLATSSARLQP